MAETAERTALLQALELQIAWGADEAIADVPVDRLRPAPIAPQAGPPRTAAPGAAAPRPAPAQPAPAQPAPAQPAPAQPAPAAADSADDLPALRAAIAGFTACRLRDTATSLVFASGDPAAGIVLIGGAPTADDDRSGTPFAGADGALLDAMLASIGLSRDDLLLTPALPWRPPGDRPVTPAEIALCRPFLLRLLALVRPRLLLLAGPVAAQAVGAPVPARPTRPDWLALALPHQDAPVPALPLPALAALRRTPARKRDAWAALRLLRRRLDAELAGK
jgi:DNA polymerase